MKIDQDWQNNIGFMKIQSTFKICNLINPMRKWIAEAKNKRNAAWSIVKTESGARKGPNDVPDIMDESQRWEGKEDIVVEHDSHSNYIETSKETGVSPNSLH